MLNAKMRAGQAVLGLILRTTRSSEIARIARATGHDFLFIDRQHAAFDLETVEQIAIAARGEGVATLVRVSGAEDPDIGRMLDVGANGIVVPDIESAEQAVAVVNRCKFAPIGRRSVVGGGPFFDYANIGLAEAITIVNDSTTVACMIESRAGLAAVDEIASVAGVDVLHIGCNDLLVDMGRPGDFGGAEIAAAVDQVLSACRRHDVIAGFGGDRDIDRQAAFVKAGGRFLTMQSDTNYLLEAARDKTAALKARLSP